VGQRFAEYNQHIAAQAQPGPVSQSGGGGWFGGR